MFSTVFSFAELVRSVMLTRWLIKKFIKDDEMVERPDVRLKYGLLEGWMSVAVNLALFGIKVFGGVAVNSVSLIADAIHSLSDMLSSATVIYGFRAAAAPADREHPYGHGRVENIVALIIAILLIVTGLEFLRAGVMRIFAPVAVEYNPIVIFLLVLTILVKYWLSAFSEKLGKIIDSRALAYDAQHHKSDMFTSLVVLLPLFSEKTGFISLDGIVGVLIAGYIIYSGVDMIREVLSPLIGESATYEELFLIKSIAMSTKGVLGIHDIMVHKYGYITIISLHAEISEETTLVTAHEIIEDVEEKINIRMKATTIVHMDPRIKMTEEVKKIDKKLLQIIGDNPALESYHDLRIVMVKENPVMILDVVAAVGTPNTKVGIIRKHIISELQKSFPECTIKVLVEPKFHFTI